LSPDGNNNRKPFFRLMSQVYSRTIKLQGDAGAIYDSMSSFLLARGFTFACSDRPNTIVADRGSLRPTGKIEKYPHTLTIALHPAADGIMMSFLYIMSDFWHYTPGDRLFFNNEIDLFARGLTADGIKVEQAAPSAVAAENGYIEELRQLSKLKSEGVLSIEEFDQKKRKLLGI
jgi:hypothetical protein